MNKAVFCGHEILAGRLKFCECDNEENFISL